MNEYFGYVRISTLSQKTDRQKQALEEYAVINNIKFACIFEDKQSGKDFDRMSYQVMKSRAHFRDIIVVKELDRLGRNYEEIKKELSFFQSKGVKVKILDLTTFNIDDDALYSLLNSLMLELLSYIAQKEREKIQSSVIEGLQRAKDKGVKLGRPARVLPKEFEKYHKRWEASEINAVEFSKLLGVSRATLYRYITHYNRGTL